MILVTLMYPESADARFDYDYYVQRHIPMVTARLKEAGGLQEVQLYRGVGAPAGGQAAYRVLCFLWFNSLAEFQAGVAKHGTEIFSDRPNFTTIQPVVQISDPLG